MDRLLEAGVRGMDRGKGKRIRNELQEVVADDSPHLPISHCVIIRAGNGNISGFQPNPDRQHYTWRPNAWWIRKA